MHIASQLGLLITLVSGAASCAPAQGESAPWYRGARRLDLTGDGRSDSVVVLARGPRPDSLDVELTFFVAGRAAHTEAWRSDYELIDVEPAVRERPQLDRYMRERLDRALLSIEVEPLDTASVRAISDSPDVLEDLDPVPAVQVALAYGYETVMALAWDASRGRFVVLYACC